MNRESIRRQFLDRKRENEALLEASFAPEFRFKRVNRDGEAEVTEEYRQTLRNAIRDYQQAADMLAPHPGQDRAFEPAGPIVPGTSDAVSP